VHDDAGDRVAAAADRDGHRQRGVGELGVVVPGEREPDDAPRANVQHRRQVQRALAGGISVPSPYHLRFSAPAPKRRPIRSGARHRP
jgi:hypothetical protein